jgi:hypothetical protein
MLASAKGGSMSPSHEPPPTSNGLKWCHACGDWVDELHDDNTCILCLEIDVRADAFVGAAMEDFAERSIGVALDYLHVDDVRVVIGRLLEDPLRANDAIPRLSDRYRLAHEFIERRTARTRQGSEHRATDCGQPNSEGRPSVDHNSEA